MSEDGHASAGQFAEENNDRSYAAAELLTAEQPAYRRAWASARRLLLQGAALLGAFVLFTLLLTAGAGWYTSRSEFCKSCHVMEPYYVSWQTSSHRDVPCIKCHFPPGAGEKVRGKLLGLVQLAKYVTASQGPRPAAEIPDASCLRSGCHEERLLSGRVDFHGIPFDHRPHLEELRREKQLRCTSCHSQIVQGAHMTVTTSTCFLCHFKGEHFNEGLGACTRCHQIPAETFDLGGGVKFDHELAYEKGVDCANCHGDLIHGTGEVPQERCTVCHNRPNDLLRINDVVFIHKAHVTDHKVDCLACHLQIQHSLDPHKIESAASDCTACHPNQHHEQVEMLKGVGGQSIPAHPSGMSAARIACPTCHRTKQLSATGTVLIKATLQACAACHDEAEVADLSTYHTQLQEAVTKLIPDMERIRAALDAAKLAPEEKTKLASQLNVVQHDVDFLQAADGIHNSHYAGALSGAIMKQLTSICSELNAAPPDVEFPAPPNTRVPGGKNSPNESPGAPKSATEAK